MGHKVTNPAQARTPRTFGLRAYVGGFLYVEGIVCLLLGLVLLLAYWPPYSTSAGTKPNPVSLVGLWICGFSVAYMFLVGAGFFVYNLLRPPQPEQQSHLAERADRYRAAEGNHLYLFDQTICSHDDADEAWLVRQLY
jgi:hypothetical protein